MASCRTTALEPRPLEERWFGEELHEVTTNFDPPKLDKDTLVVDALFWFGSEQAAYRRFRITCEIHQPVVVACGKH